MFRIFEKKAYTDLNSAEFENEQKQNSNAVVVDVRTRGEFTAGKIPGAVNIDMMSPDFERKVSCLDKNKSYLVYCRSGNRSAHACEVMAARGLKASNLAGGIVRWQGKLV